MPTLWSPSAGQQRRQRTGQPLLAAAAGPVVTGYAATAALLALVTATAPGATLSTGGVLRAAGPAWLALYHVPVDIHGRTLGVLPLLPTALILMLVARSAGNAADRLAWDTPRAAVRVIAAVAAAHAVAGTAIALLGGLASPAVAGALPAVLSAVAATVGTAVPCGLLDAVLARADDATVTGLRAAGLAVAGLAAVGAAVFAVGLVASWSTAVHVFRAAAPGPGSGLGMFLLCLAFLPNVLVGALAFAAGPGFSIGHVMIAQWHFHAGALPAVPVLAPLPASIGTWWLALLVLPAAVGVLVGLACRRLDAGTPTRLRAVGVAALGTAVTWLVLAALAGGALAGGPFDPVTVPAGALAVATGLLVGVPGALTVWLGRPRAGEPEDSPVHEAETDTA